MSPQEMSARALASIAADLKVLIKLLSRTSAPAAAPGEEIAGDADLDGQYGDPEIRKDPKDWKESSYVGMRYSDAPAEYLDMLAGFLRWKAGKNDEEAAAETDPEKKKKLAKYAKYARTDAARARGWAHRKRNGWAKSESQQQSGGEWNDAPAGDFGGDNEIPF